jgi:hypothetical protein
MTAKSENLLKVAVYLAIIIGGSAILVNWWPPTCVDSRLGRNAPQPIGK